MRRCVLPVFMALATFCVASAAMAQDATSPRARIEGRVVEVEVPDYGIPGAEVSIEGTETFTVTDELGYFVLDDVPEGSVTILVREPSYKPLTRTLSPTDRDGEVILAMEWAGEEYSSTTVSARERTETASTTTLTPRDISSAPHRNAEEVLRQVPGLTLVQHGSEGKGHQFFIRGFDAIHGSDLELTLEGMPVNEWSNVHAQGYIDLGIIIPEFIVGVGVTKGPFALEQGAFAMAGSADYRLGVLPEESGLRAAYTIGTTNRHRVFTSYSREDGQFIGVEATHDDSFGENRAIDRASINSRVSLWSDAENALSLLMLGSHAAFELPGTLRNDDVQAGRVGFYDAYDEVANGRSSRALAALLFTRERDNRALSVTGYGGYRRLELLENFTGFLVDPVNGDRRDQHQSTWSFGAFGKHESRLSEQFGLIVGAGARGDRFAQDEANVGQELEVISQRRDLEVTQLITHALAGARWRPSDRLRLDVGARLDAVTVSLTDHLQEGSPTSSRTLLVASPRANTRYTVSESLRLFATYGRGFRPPEARAFSDLDAGRMGFSDEVSDGAPANTVSDSGEVGLRWDPADWFGASLAGFATRIERESLFDHVSGLSIELNGTRRLGGEVVVYSNPLSWLSLSADATLVDARFIESGNRVPLAPWLVGGLRATATHPGGFQAGARVLAVAPRALPHGARGATLVMTDATLGYRWRRLSLDLEVENILGQELREGEYHYASHWEPEEPASELPVIHTTAGPPRNARLTLGVIF